MNSSIGTRTTKLNRNMKFVLSVDGGGIRGIIPSLVLSEIEKRTNRSICQIFDLMVGTSVGGIIVAGLCKKNEQGRPKYSAQDFIELYLNYGKSIFQSSNWKRKLASQINVSRYAHKKVESILDKYFGEDTFVDISNNLMITSYDIKNNCPFFFKSWKKSCNNVKLKDALRATTAAPTYFVPKKLKISELERVLIDGGVFAYNPAACAYASGKNLFPNDDIVVLSTGTGISDKRKSFQPNVFGRVNWVKPLLNIMSYSSLECVNYQLSSTLGADRYIRIQLPLRKSGSSMDNATTSNLEYLQEEANVLIKKEEKAISEFCKMVS